MKLSDIMSASGLSSYAQVALILFLLAFIVVVISIMLPSRRRLYEHLRHLPIEPDRVRTTDRDEGVPHA